MRKLLVLILLLYPGVTSAADLVSIADGNFTTAATWGLADTVSKVISTSTSTTTLTTGNLNSATFVLPANQVQGFMVRLASRATGTPTNTMTLTLLNNTTSASACAATINVSDLPASTTANDNGGWIRVRCSSPFTPNGTDNYLIRATLSATTTAVVLSTNGTASNWQRLVIRSTTQAPAAADDLHVLGYFDNSTNPATVGTRTVTVDNTATTVFGAAATNVRTPALTVSKGGTLTFATDGGNYQYRVAGFVVVHSSGTIAIGTSGTPVPRAGSVQFEMVLSANLQGQIYLKGGTWDQWGQSRTSGKNVLTTRLTANAAAAATSLSVADDTGWLNGDQVAVAASGAATGAGLNANRDEVALTAGAGASSLTVAALTYAHTGNASGPRYAEVELLTRNVRLIASGSSFVSSIQVYGAAILRLDWASIQRFGYSTVYGIEEDAAFTGTVSLTNSVMWNMPNNGTSAVLTAGTGTTTIQDSSIWIDTNVSTGIVNVTNDTTTLRRVRLSATGNGRGLYLSNSTSCASTYDTVTIAGANAGLEIAGASQTVMCNPTFTSFRAHTMDQNGIYIVGDTDSLTMTDPVIWGAYTAGYGALRVESGTNHGPWTFTNPTFVSNYAGFSFGSSGVQQSVGSANTLITVTGGIFANYSDAVRGVAAVLVGTANRVSVKFAFTGTAFGTAAGAGYSDFTTANFIQRSTIGSYSVYADINATCDGCTFGSTTAVTGLTDANVVTPGSSVSANTASNAKASASTGEVAYEGTTCDVVPCLKLTPSSAARKLQSNAGVSGRGFMVAVQSGQTPAISVKIRKDGTYNGNAPRLLVYPVGSSTATVLGTFSASANTWQTVSGTMSAASADGAVEVVVDCDGTAGNVYVDTFAATGSKGIDGSLSWFYRGNAVASAPGLGTGVALPTAPTAPSSPSATANSAFQVTVNWTDASSDEDGFRVERCAGAACSDFADVVVVPAGSSSWVNAGLSESTVYRYRVRAYNSGGNSAYSSTVSATTDAAAVVVQPTGSPAFVSVVVP